MNRGKLATRSLNLFLVGVLILSALPTVLIINMFGGTASAASVSQGPRYATATGDCIDQTGIGTIVWTTPGDAFSSNDTRTTAALASNGNITHYLKCTNFGFTVPTGATIQGVTMAIERYSSVAAKAFDSQISIIKGGVIGTTNRATATAWAVAPEASVSYGSTSDLWGETWASTDINATTFGAAVAVVRTGGGGAPTVSVDAVSLTVQYLEPELFTLEQSAYRWFNNANSLDVGTALNGVAQDTGTTALATQQPFRLRMALHVGSASAPSGSGIDSKLQYAPRGADNVCDTSFTNETYVDVTAATAIAYTDNASPTDGQAATGNTNDPVHSGHTKIMQEYNELNNTSVSSTIASGQDGVWDFALKNNDAPAGTAYCFRMVRSTGGLLSTYSVVPMLTTLGPEFSQENYRWYKGQDSVGNNTFVQAWGGTVSDNAKSVVTTFDGGYAVTGFTYSYAAGMSDMFLAKYDSSGTLSWSRTWGGSGDESGRSLVQTSDGGYAITGYTSTATYTAGGNDMFLAKYDSSGTLSWSKTWGGTGADYGRSVVQTSDGGYAITGETANFGAVGNDMFLAKYDSSGTLSWSKTWGGTGSDSGRALVQTSDGGYAVTGDTASFGSGIQTFLAKYDSTGTLSWNKTWGGAGTDFGFSLVQTSDGGYAITGYTDTVGYTAGADDAFLAKYDSSGTLSWSKTWGGTGADEGYSIIQTSDGGYAITGFTASFGANSDEMFLAKYDSTGTLSWNKTWGGAAYEEAFSLVQTSDGGYAVIGQTFSHGAGADDAFLAKYDSAGNIAGCSSTMCASPTVTVSAPSAGVGAPSATVGAPTVTLGAPTVGVSSPTATVTPVAGQATFIKSWGGTGADYGRYVVQSADGGYTVTGDTASFTAGGSDMFIANYDGVGNLQWSKTWGGTGNEVPKSILNTSDGGYVVTGQTLSFGAAGDMFLAKYTSAGVLSWDVTWGGTAAETGYSITETSDGGLVVIGDTATFTAGSTDAFVAKYTSAGTFSWSKTLGTTGADHGYAIDSTTDGGFVISGSVINTTAESWIVKYDSSGTVTWNKRWGGTGSEYGSWVIQTSDGGYVLVTQQNSFGGNGYDIAVTKYDSTGTLVWDTNWGGSSGTPSDVPLDVIEAGDGGIVVAGHSIAFGDGTTNPDALLIKYSATGTLLWDRTWGTTAGYDSARSLKQSPDGGYIVGGYTNSLSASYDMFIAKYDSSGNIANCPTNCKDPAATITNPSATVGDATGTSVKVEVTDYTSSRSSPAATEKVDGTDYTSTKTTNTALGIWSDIVAVPTIPIGDKDNPGTSIRHDDPVRLRLTLKGVNFASPSADAALKLQVAPKVGTCDIGFTGETYADISGSVAFNYYNNATPADGDWARVGANDPTIAAGTLSYENYEESATFTNRHHIAVDNYGLWDISLTTTDNAVYGGYCFRVVNNDNSNLSNYTRIFELAIPPAASEQMRHGKFFDTSTGTAQPFYW